MGFGEIVWNVHKCKMVSAAQFSALVSVISREEWETMLDGKINELPCTQATRQSFPSLPLILRSVHS